MKFALLKQRVKISEVLFASKKQKQKWALKLYSEPHLHHAKQQASQQYEFLFCVEIPWPLLRLWVDLLDGNSMELSYIGSAVDGLFTIKRGCLCTEELLHVKASTVRQAYRKTQGSKHQHH